MNPKLKKALQAMGLKKDATDAEAQAFIEERSINVALIDLDDAEPQQRQPVQVMDTKKIAEDARNDERLRQKEIRKIGQTLKQGDAAEKAIEDGTSIHDFQCQAIERMGARKVTPSELDGTIGMEEKDVRQFSITRAAHCIAEKGHLDGFEKEVSDEVAKKLKRQAQGFFLPVEVAQAGLAQVSSRQAPDVARQMLRMSGNRSMHAQLTRALEATTFGSGGAFVGTDVLGGSLIELLRNLPLVAQLGATVLDGLQGNIAIPKQLGAATAYWLSESEELTTGDQSTGQVGLTPKRLGAGTPYTKQFLAQSSVAVEAFVRMDLMQVLAIAKDLAAINGSGGDGEPLGIMNTDDINTVTFGAAPTWAKAVEFETAIETDNVLLDGTASYLTTSPVKGAWKTTAKVSGQPIYIWGENGQVNGYPARNTQQVPSNRVIFGKWSDLILADWSGMDVVVDPYSLKKKGQIEIVIQILTDVAVRHAEAFAVSTDAGNQ